jgi:hypothetical protein
LSLGGFLDFASNFWELLIELDLLVLCLLVELGWSLAEADFLGTTGRGTFRLSSKEATCGCSVGTGKCRFVFLFIKSLPSIST